ncbi:MAG: hypothetical protein KA408_12245 [Flavobacteriales bacterium]|nr:hypothetical protein [Flavobacteriales bacterium]
MSLILRSALVALLFCSATAAQACTFFKITKDGRTIVGNNEDAWSINAQVWFRNGGPGEYGAVYFAHYNGSPMRQMIDQGGMNSEGLIYDALVVENREIALMPNTRITDFATLLPKIMHSCATVHEAEKILRKYTVATFDHAMLVLVDRNGDYLVAEGDTLYTGNDATFALGNFRMSRCVDIDSVPIERYQNGRELIANGVDVSVAFGTSVLNKMAVRRGSHDNREGLTGTLYSNLYDPQNGIVHLYFYHDYNTVRSFNVREELAKGDHELDMAAIFPPNADYEKLVAYITPFHQRWLFYLLVAFAGLTGLTLLYSSFGILRRTVSKLRGASSQGKLALLTMSLSSIALLTVTPFLLLNEGVYYFGLGYATDAFSALLKYVPAFLGCLLIALLIFTYSAYRTDQRFVHRSFLTMNSGITVIMVGLFVYWGIVIP